MVVRNLREDGMSEMEEGFNPCGDERKRRLRKGRDLGHGSRGIWEL